MSVSPPGGAATTSRTGRDGYCCAEALPAMEHEATAKTVPKARSEARNIRFLLARRVSRFGGDAITSARGGKPVD
jgi:hypothetical protein